MLSSVIESALAFVVDACSSNGAQSTKPSQASSTAPKWVILCDGALWKDFIASTNPPATMKKAWLTESVVGCVVSIPTGKEGGEIRCANRRRCDSRPHRTLELGCT